MGVKVIVQMRRLFREEDKKHDPNFDKNSFKVKHLGPRRDTFLTSAF